MAPLTAPDVANSLSKEALLAEPLKNYLNRCTFNVGSELAGHVDGELRQMLLEKDATLKSKRQVSITASLSTEQKSRLEEYFPELYLKFKDSSHSDHPFANAMRTCLNAHFVNLLRGDSIIDVGGSLSSHLSCCNKNIHICNPILNGKDVARRFSEASTVKNLAADPERAADLAFRVSLESCTTCEKPMHKCRFSATNAMCVDVYDMSLRYIVDAMHDRDIHRLVFAAMLPVELLEPRGEVMLRDTNTVVRWSERTFGASTAEYFIQGTGECYSHSLDDLRGFLSAGKVVSKNGGIFHIMFDGNRGDYKLFTIIRVGTDKPLFSSLRRYPSTLNGMYKVSIPVDLRSSYEIKDLFLDEDFVARVKSYLVNTTSSTNDRNYEYTMSCLRSQKTHLIVGSRVVHSKVELDPNELPIVAATFLRDAVGSRRRAIEVANIAGLDDWSFWRWIKFIVSKFLSIFSGCIKTFIFFLLRVFNSDYYNFLAALRKPLERVEEQVEVKLTQSTIFLTEDDDLVDHEGSYRRVVETAKKDAVLKSVAKLEELFRDAVASQISVEKLIEGLKDEENVVDSLKHMWRNIAKNNNKVTAEEINAVEIDNIIKDPICRDKMIKERTIAEGFSLEDLAEIERLLDGNNCVPKVKPVQRSPVELGKDALEIEGDVLVGADKRKKKSIRDGKRVAEISTNPNASLLSEIKRRSKSLVVKDDGAGCSSGVFDDAKNKKICAFNDTRAGDKSHSDIVACADAALAGRTAVTRKLCEAASVAVPAVVAAPVVEAAGDVTSAVALARVDVPDSTSTRLTDEDFDDDTNCVIDEFFRQCSASSVEGTASGSVAAVSPSVGDSPGYRDDSLPVSAKDESPRVIQPSAAIRIVPATCKPPLAALTRDDRRDDDGHASVARPVSVPAAMNATVGSFGCSPVAFDSASCDGDVSEAVTSDDCSSDELVESSSSSDASDSDCDSFRLPRATEGLISGGYEKAADKKILKYLRPEHKLDTLTIFKKCLLSNCDWAVARDPIFAMRRMSACPSRSVPAEFRDKAGVEYMLHAAVSCYDLYAKYLKLCGQVKRVFRTGDICQETKDSFRSLNVFRKFQEKIFIDGEPVSPQCAYAVFDIEEQRFVTAADMKNSSTKGKYYACCDDLFKGINFRILGALVKFAGTCDVDLVFDEKKITLENTPPGGGKTTRLVTEYLKNPVGCLIVTANSGSADDINSELAKKKKKQKERIARTADSRLINWVSQHKMNVLRVDECFLMHYGQLKFIAAISMCPNVVLYGDENQIPFINRIKCFSCNNEVLKSDGVDVINIDGSYRCPGDVCFYLSSLKKVTGERCYPLGVKKLNGERGNRSLSSSPILSVDDVPTSGFDVYVTYTQMEKNMLQASLIRRKCAKTVLTVHQVQGKTYGKVAVVRIKPADDQVFNSLGHHIVAISRHTESMKYFCLSRKLDDRLSKAINAMGTVKDELLRGVDCINGPRNLYYSA
ncbi:replication-associated polyprotein [Citrus associated ampelovirus 1]|nr:replication-associated polyprotein [Citrus associated ampelovirus 1]